VASRSLPTRGSHLRHLRLVRPGEHGLDSGVVPTRSVEGSPSAPRRGGRLPYLLLGSTVLLTGLGVVMVLSASNVYAYRDFGSSFWFFKRQIMYVAVGLLAIVVTSFIPYRVWRSLCVPILAVSVLLLILVLHPALADARTTSSSGGATVGGATRWIALGPVTVQPSELAKLALILLGATVLAKKWHRLDEPAHVAIPLLPVLALLAGLVMLQPDLGTTMILAGIAFILLFVAGVRLRYLFLGGVVASGLGMALVLSEGYRRVRFLSFLDPFADAHASGYQVVQSLLALGSGGWTGVGLGASRGKWLYVPNAHTDFVFSIVGEELGLIGALAVLVVFGGLVYAGIRVAMGSQDVFGRLLAAGIVGWLGLQALVNLGAVTGVLPVTGVPLPLVSFGGSSLIVTLAALGILINVGRTSGPPSRNPGPPEGPMLASAERG
jgi:cell division protein FtsW